MNWGVILAIGFLLLLLLWAAGRGGSLASNRSNSSRPAAHLVQLPPYALLGRCLSVEDVQFAASLGSPAVERLLLQERRRFALEWLWQTRKEASRLFRLHTKSVRHATDLRPAREVALLFQAGLFLVVYATLVLAVRLHGPFRTRRFVQALHGLAGLLAELGSRIAAAAPAAGIPEAARG